ncbi:MAG: ferritin family protein [Deltaproteobacteria bacterium]|nr:ferritin family protein [Deltaproteobacteria bacterium]MBW2070374.1 ferritin family protein [Deltaproteobacteria bacterium]
MFSISEVIDLAVRIEENAEKYYLEAAEKMADSTLSKLLLQLAEQEREHVAWFLRLKEETAAKGVQDLAEDEAGGLQQFLGDQKFSLGDTDLSRLQSIDDILAVAIEFEQDTILFYSMLGSFIETAATSEALEKIIAEEERHIELLEEHRSGK